MVGIQVWLLIAFASGIHGTPNTLATISSRQECEATRAQILNQVGKTYIRLVCVSAVTVMNLTAKG